MTHERPILATVVVPTYNQCQWLKRAVQSVLDQRERRFELIVVDDASSDATSAVVAQFRDSRLRYVRRDENSGGPALPMSEGVALARGPLIAFLDQDDRAEPIWIERLIAAFNDPRVGMAWGRLFVQDTSERVVSVSFRNPFRAPTADRLLPTLLTWTPGTSGLMVRRAVFQEIGGFDQAAGPVADLEFTLRLGLSRRWTVRVLDDVLTRYSVHGSNLSGQASTRLAEALEHVLDKHAQALDPYPAARAHYLYRLARHYEDCDRLKANRLLDQSIRLDPRRLKYRAYRLVRGAGGRGAWAALSTAHVLWSAARRQARHRAEAGRKVPAS